MKNLSQSKLIMTCLQDTYNFLTERRAILHKGIGRYNIVHSVVQRFSDNLRHPHAVVFDRKLGMILEVSNKFKHSPVVVPFMIWMREGRVSDIKIYTHDEIRSEILKHETWDFYHDALGWTKVEDKVEDKYSFKIYTKDKEFEGLEIPLPKN